ncbi:ASCH domain-containing protein [Sporomusa sphaeroides]|uniref:ASCH domain-containing protein n=1 Tax=Sporomusa sphaeroides TaxID=47679 RepID=UPI00202DCDD4|nr:ASCH domain-containing protein [Sporomusa sphaeroides]MCM0759966.1 ASCH domain-containing protein [Sporomusa sphaeroides DSM 2875]HML33835.1 ASCH domain-containing protein [Sporomusa sphaeroides]
MKAITIHQPWASLIACGAKQIETRSWATKYRGPIAIHAGKSWTMFRREITYCEPFHSALWPNMTKDELSLNGYGRTQLLPVGAVIAIAELVDCVKVIGFDQFANSPILDRKDWLLQDAKETAFGDYSIGRYAWILTNVRAIEPVPAKGMQRLWEWEGDVKYA